MVEALKIRVLDACALMAYLDKTAEWAKMIRLFEKAHLDGQPLLMSSVNWCEVLVSYVKMNGPGATDNVDRIVDNLPLKILDADRWTSAEAAKLKAHYGFSLGDAFAAATAIQHQAVLVTNDLVFKIIESQIEIERL